MNLDFSSLVKAVSSLEKAIKVSTDEERMSLLDKDQKDTIRAGVIQNFEFTYELCWKFMQRWLKENQTEMVDLPRTRKDLFRLAAKHGLIRDPLPWFEYGDARNLTSHTYSPDKAEIVYEKAISFFPDALFLLNQLKANNG